MIHKLSATIITLRQAQGDTGEVHHNKKGSDPFFSFAVSCLYFLITLASKNLIQNNQKIMKKLLILISLLTLISCTNKDKKIRLDFSIHDKKSNIGNEVKIRLAVVDDRLENNFIGTKEYCDNGKINITTQQNLAELLKQKISDNLLQKGFKNGNDKLIEIHIEQLQYKAECGFLLGKSEAEVAIKVTITDVKSGAKITKNFEVSANNKHFILPLASTDEKVVNDILEVVVEDILNNNALLKNLTQ